MAVRSFMTIVADTARLGVTVVQGREHAPPMPSFNGRKEEHKDGVSFDEYVADLAASRGLITPHQRYEIAMQRDIG